MAVNTLDEKTVQVAAMVIMHAGNARTLVHDALKKAECGDLKCAESLLDQAAGEIAQAHTTQTEVIQAEARGEPVQISLLFTHAQDTLMIAMSEMQMARHMLVLYRHLNIA